MLIGTHTTDSRGNLVHLRTRILVGALAFSTLGAIVATTTPAAGAPTALAPAAPTSDVTGAYYKLTPTRVLDTRFGTGVAKAPLGAGRSLSLKVTDKSGIPTASAVSAVVLNLTVTNPTVGGYVVAYPHDRARPSASTINFPKGFTGANLVTVPIGASGTVDIFNALGTVDVIADVIGFYAGDNSPASSLGPRGGYRDAVPSRLYDSRVDPDEQGQIYPFSDHDELTLPVDFDTNPAPGGPRADINRHVTALVVNVTTVSQTSSGFVRTWDGGTEPATSTVNFARYKTVANAAIVPTMACALQCGTNGPTGAPSMKLKVYTTGGSTQVIVDLVGVMLDGPGVDFDGSPVVDFRFKAATTPTRIVDTRFNIPTGASRLGQHADYVAAAPVSIAGEATRALVGNVTAVKPTTSTLFVLWGYFPGDAGTGRPGARPGISNINAAPGDIVANAAVIPVGDGNRFHIYNNLGFADALVDVAGTFEEQRVSTSAASGAASGSAPLVTATRSTPRG